MESFGTRLADLRREHNLTQNDIADRLNISAQAVSKWENDLTSPDIDTLLKLSDIFNITVDELLGKKKQEPVYVPTEERKDINKMVLRITVDSNEGDKVRVNLPMAAVKIFLNNDSVKLFSGNKALENIDFNQIYTLVEQGIIGELVSVDSADGEHVRITVE
ncbi:MAG: helix-turn-helix domain-containing protein [Erysipelotrichaceae bacterium]|nr:helix-turn-helix domain-containing protein [Erysipelotrichaceae bacterium]